ncbi:MerR family transcriptional regulator [Martelella mediterranea]|uniref:DNA-binding transcriptional MerR regulator n=1 Tax=Martelella mediterranea TaxID=293089 RepID=A0A4R3NWY5_9HYPH|nr:MerR family transcriptional regulator [Martelella mediterranea]TCT42883.1 DNA-binding transcriptional MerR regulator [Martelella mediterranea]
MEKSPEAFRTISEVAEELELPQHVLRFWETRFTQVKPMKRGGGRRYYRPEDVELLKGIRHLLYDHGYTIKGVQKLLRSNGNRFVTAIGSGDAELVEALTPSADNASGDERRETHDEPTMFDDDQVVGRSRKPASKGFFRRNKNDDSAVGPASGLGRSDDAQLQDVLYDLLECKRLLDQVR